MLTRRIQRGFTLVEAGIVLAVSAIAVSTAAPGFGQFIEQQRLKNVAAQLAADIRFARAESVLRNTALRLTRQNASWGSCYVIHTGSAGQCSCHASGLAQCSGGARALKTVLLPAAQRISLQSHAASILFDPLHGTTTPANTFKVVAASGRAVHHVVNIMGRVHSCSLNGSVPGYAVC
jgi:type IV fimbrial biogenesis protein FimT